MERLIECVPNFSEGRNMDIIESIVAEIKGHGVEILNVDPGEATNRTVVTFIGTPENVVEAAFHGVRRAAELIDMRKHHGTHPRSGATDVLPLIPISGISLEECAELARKLAERIYNELEIPCYCYESAAFKPQRKNLAVCRAGEYEALSEKMAEPERKPDFGPGYYTERAAQAGAINIGARNFLIAVNFNLNTTSTEIANEIAYRVREKGHPGRGIEGKLKGCKAIGWFIEEYGIAQVSMNITDINATPLHVAFEEVSRVAESLGVKVTGTEIIGLVPKKVLVEAGKYFLEQHLGKSEEEIMEAAVRSMGLDDLKPYDTQKRVIPEMARLSVVMSFFNEPLQWIRLAVQSILNQTYRNFEFIIICDNADNKAGIEYIEGLAASDARIKLVINQTNLGPTKCLNKAISLAKGEYIARMDADDIAHKERFEKQIAYLDADFETMVCATDVHVVDEDGRILRRNRYKRKYDPTKLLLQNTISHPTVMFRKSLAEVRTPIYNEDFLYAQDYELWQYLYLRGIKPYTLQEPLLLLRKSKVQISCSKKLQQTELFRTAHKHFIKEYLVSKNIINLQEADDLRAMLKKCSDAYQNMEGLEQKELSYIIYLLYLSLSIVDWKYIFKYLTDRNLIVLRMRFIFTLRMLFSRKVRRRKVGLI